MRTSVVLDPTPGTCSIRRAGRPVRQVVVRAATGDQPSAATRRDQPSAATTRRAALLATTAAVVLPGLPGPARADEQAASPPLTDAAVPRGLKVASTVELGSGTGLRVSPLGIGAWSWGDRTGFWGWNSSYAKEDVQSAYGAAMDAGISLLDTAEAYGFGLSERLVREFGAGDGRAPIIATKFAPLPWRAGRGDVVAAARSSCERLGAARVGLYQLHWPGALPGQTESYVEGLGDVVDAGLAAAVGVSNFKASRVDAAAKALGARGIPLASNQVQYSLLYRVPEQNDVLAATKAAGATLIAYSPLAQGLLTGKFTEAGPFPSGPRAATITAARVKAVAPLIALMRAVGAEHASGDAGPDGAPLPKTPTQVALAWCVARSTVPIPGVKNARQAADAAGALGLVLRPAEVDELDAVSGRIAPGLAFPTEKW